MNRKLWMNPQEAAVSLGISVKTLRRWDKAGKPNIARTAGHHRRVCIGLQAQEGTLARQLERLRVAAAAREYQVVQTIAEYASSLNEKRRGMQKRLSLVEQQAVDVLLLDYPDRLVRFGFSSLQEALRSKSEQEERAA